MTISVLCFLSSLLLLGRSGATIINSLIPIHQYNPNNWLFRERKHEVSFYRFLRINRWKDYLPQNNRSFSKRNIETFNDPDYIHTFALQTCRGETVHFLLGLFSLPLTAFAFLAPDPIRAFFVLLKLWGIFATCQWPFIWVQRYNRPRLLQLEKVIRRKQERMRTTGSSAPRIV